MPEYLSPGVYVEEVGGMGPKPLQSPSTSTAVFIGFTEKADNTRMIDGEPITYDLLNKATFVTNWTQFVKNFGSFVEGATLPHAVHGFFLNGGQRCYVVSVRTLPTAKTALLNKDGQPQLIVESKQGGLSGLKLRVEVNVPEPSVPAPTSDEGEKAPSEKISTEQPFTMTVKKQGTTGSWLTKEVLKDVTLVEAPLPDGTKEIRLTYKNNKPSKLVDIVIPDSAGEELSLATIWPRSQEQTLSIQEKLIAPPEYQDFKGDVTKRSGIEGLAALDDVNIIVLPDLMTKMPGQKLDLDLIKATQTLLIAHCENMGDRVCVLDVPPNLIPTEARDWRMDITGYDTSYAAMYYPWIRIMDPATNRYIFVPPSGHIAGVWARTDNTRGVHKAPANEIIQGSTGLEYNVTSGEQSILNPNGVNCIRAFPGMGIRIWGARTISSDAEWRYISVRRVFNMIKKAIERGTMWTVFEPNDPVLWGRITRDVSGYLNSLWAVGALAGGSPAEAFFVKCDAELNTKDAIDRGELLIEVGVAPSKPAEFVIFRISQMADAAGGGEE